MAEEDEERRKRERRRQREDEQDREELKRKGLAEEQGDQAARFEELITRAEPMIEQVESLYMQYIRGVEKRPPLERRKQLEQIMMTLQYMPKATQSTQFRYNAVHARFVTHKDRWDRLTRDLESGKIVRRLIGYGPGRSGAG